MSPKNSIPHETKKNIAFSASIIALFAISLLVGVIFSLPLPFVRRIWLNDLWGYYGLMNSVCFLLLSQAMRSMHVSAVFAGFGLLLHEQIRAWRSFLYIHSQHQADTTSFVYMAASVLLAFILLSIFVGATISVFRYQKFKREHPKSSDEEKTPENKLQNYYAVIYLAIYAVFYVLLKRVSELEYKTALPLFPLLGMFVLMSGFFAIGLEADKYFKEGKIQIRSMCVSGLYAILIIYFQYLAFSASPISKVVSVLNLD